GRVIVVSDGDGAGTAASPEATLVFVDATDPSAPRTASTLRLGGRLTAARIADGRIWTVVRNRPAVEGFDRRWLDPAANDRWLAGLTADAVLPSLRVDGSPPRPLAPPEACLLQPGAVEDPYEVTPVTTIAAFDLAAPDAPPLARCVAAPVDTVLVSRGTLVAAASRWTLVDAGDGTGAALGERVTDVHRFALSSASIAYRGSATVPGRLDRGRDTGRFMMSIDGPRLRVLTQRDAPGSAGPAHLTVLEDRGVGDLATVSTLPNARRPEPIGKPGEQVHAVRFVGTRAYVVTFLRIDPVYAIDLSDPTDPRVLGALEVPGFSDRLYPVADGLLLGLGYDTTGGQGFDLPGGVLVSLIDVRNPARPVERARRVLGQRGSGSAADLSPLGTTIRIAGDRVRIALPVWVHEGAAWPSSWSEPESLRPRDFSRLAAYRWNVDPATATLSDAPPVVAPDASTDGVAPMRGRAGASRAFDRAIDVGDTTWLWYDGRFAAGAW
ncbi:MAG TPA: beta-propeller domain-containing protein, partial [Burkholderiaceae bacterium]|nr:beta-propeller domain-containing protein [Burkholderiaceae bacterium]